MAFPPNTSESAPRRSSLPIFTSDQIHDESVKNAQKILLKSPLFANFQLVSKYYGSFPHSTQSSRQADYLSFWDRAFQSLKSAPDTILNLNLEKITCIFTTTHGVYPKGFPQLWECLISNKSVIPNSDIKYYATHSQSLLTTKIYSFVIDTIASILPFSSTQKSNVFLSPLISASYSFQPLLDLYTKLVTNYHTKTSSFKIDHIVSSHEFLEKCRLALDCPNISHSTCQVIADRMVSLDICRYVQYQNSIGLIFKPLFDAQTDDSNGIEEILFIKNALGNMKLYLDSLESERQKTLLEAKSYLLNNSKTQALSRLKIAKYLEKLLSKQAESLTTLHTMLRSIQMAETSLTIHQAYKKGVSVLKQYNDSLDVEDAEETLETLHTLIGETNEISSLISQPIELDISDKELDLLLEGLSDEPSSLSVSDIPSPPSIPLSATTVPVLDAVSDVPQSSRHPDIPNIPPTTCSPQPLQTVELHTQPHSTHSEASTSSSLLATAT